MSETFTISVQEAAVHLGISERKAYYLTRTADFPTVRIGKRIRVSREGLREWVRKKEQCGGEVWE